MEHGREHPWNIRRVSHRHLHDQRNLVDLHLMTQAWLPAALPNPFDQEASLEDDTWPEHVLSRLEREIKRVQLRALAERVAQKQKLDDLSFTAGQDSASRRWTQSDPSEGSIAPADKRALLLALYHGPLGGRLGPQAFLVRRSLITEVSVELLNCPHRQAENHELPELGDAPELRDELCRQQFHWLRGHFNFLNPALSPVLSRPRGRCVVSW